MSSWGTEGTFKLKTEMRGAKLITARFYTDGVNPPKEISDPSGMLTITRIGVGVYRVALPARYVKIHVMADYQGGIPVLWSRVTSLVQGSTANANFEVRNETSAGVATESTDRPVQLFIVAMNQAGRVDEEG